MCLVEGVPVSKSRVLRIVVIACICVAVVVVFRIGVAFIISTVAAVVASFGVVVGITAASIGVGVAIAFVACIIAIAICYVVAVIISARRVLIPTCFKKLFSSTAATGNPRRHPSKSHDDHDNFDGRRRPSLVSP